MNEEEGYAQYQQEQAWGDEQAHLASESAKGEADAMAKDEQEQGEMTRQEKIQEKTKNYLVGCIHGATVSYADLGDYDKSTVDFQTDELLEEQSKLGAVLTVERELPHCGDDCNVYATKCTDCSFGWAYKRGQQGMLDDGWKATESLTGE